MRIPFMPGALGLAGSAVIAGAFIAEPVRADVFFLKDTLTSPAPRDNERFGNSVAIDGTTVLVGSGDFFGQGETAFAFDAVSGNLLQSFINPNPSPFDNFGFSVSVSGTNALIGAWGDDGRGPSPVGDSGIAYLFDVPSGGLLRTFDNPFPFGNARFGYSVALEGTNALISAPLNGFGQTGSAYLFNTDTGNLLQTFDNPFDRFNGGAESRFGFDVDISGNNVVIGAPLQDPTPTPSNDGAVFVFNAATGALAQTLNNPGTNPDPRGDQFGTSVAVDGDTIVVGAPAILDIVAGIGIENAFAYVYNADTGNLIQTISDPAGPRTGFEFGSSIDVRGDNILVGAPSATITDSDDGVAYLFNTNGDLLQTFPNPGTTSPTETNSSDAFGNAVALTDTYAVIGASQSQPLGSRDTGEAYLYEVPGPLPILGVGAAFSWSRKLRRRCRQLHNL